MENIIEIVNPSHLILNDDFHKHLEKEKAKSYSYSNYNNNYGYGGGSVNPTYGYGGGHEFYKDRCECKFFEWSNLSNTPRTFNRGKFFFDFLDACHITYTEENKSDFNKYYTFFATCKKGKSELILTRSMSELVNELNKM